MSRTPRPSDEVRPPGDPLDAAIDTGDRELLAIFNELGRMVRYFDYAEVSVETFKLLRNLALLDLFSSMDEDEAAVRLGHEIEVLRGIRGAPEYAEMCHDLRAAFEKLADPISVREHVNDVALQDRILRETVRLGLYASDERVREKALAQFNDRSMPRVTKEVQQRVLMIQRGDMELIDETDRQLESKLKQLDSGAVDAEVVGE